MAGPLVTLHFACYAGFASILYTAVTHSLCTAVTIRFYACASRLHDTGILHTRFLSLVSLTVVLPPSLGQMTKMLDVMEAYLDDLGIKALRIDGNVSWQQRKSDIADFQARDGQI